MSLFDRRRTPRDVPHSSDPPPARPPVAEVHDTDDPTLDDTVRSTLARLTAAAQGSPDTLGLREVEDVLTSRLVAQRDLPAGDRRFQYIRPFAPHIAEVLTLDLPMAVITLPEDRLPGGRHSTASLVAVGRRNLERLMTDTDVEVRRPGGRRSTCTVLVSDSPYTGSFARFLAEVVARHLPEADTGNGLVFAVPDRHALVVQTCADPRETRDALERVPAEARALHDAGTGPVSPHVYHWYHRDITCLTAERPDGSLEVTTTPVLDLVLGSGRRAG